MRSSLAGIEPYQNFIKKSIQIGDSVVVRDEKFQNPFFNWADITNISVKNSITLKLLDDEVMTQNFSGQLMLRVEYFSAPGQTSPTIIDSVTLGVNYSTTEGASYKAADTYTFANGYLVKVYVTGISSPQLGSSVVQHLQLTNAITIDRKYAFVPGAGINLSGQLSGGGSGGGFSLMSFTGSPGNRLQLSWPLVVGAEEYDIEWVTIDEGSEWFRLAADSLDAVGVVVPDSRLNSLFRNNATRVTTSGQEYAVSLLYTSKYIVVRMRQVQYNVDGIRMEGNWDYTLNDPGDPYAIWELNWHESNLNWQYSGTFAEEGKKKEVVSYFDGTLRSRQTVTINNEDQVAVVQENIYDEFGRPAASILPAPVRLSESGDTTQYLRYFQNVNLNINELPYRFSDLNSAYCAVIPGQLSTSSGASKYYSPENPFLNHKAYNKYIPDAGGYPLSVTQYTPDNTGRIRLQGGVGEAFQPDTGINRTTRYFYGKPQQWELDRIFGNDVGYASHYLKNMVIDPNGQVSISYLNASGKTIATALSGDTPAMMDSLSSKPVPVTDTVEILRPEQFVFNATSLSLKGTSTYLSAVPGQAKLIYNIEKLISRYPDTEFQPCSNCYYDLFIKVTDDCGEVVYENTSPFTIGSATADPGAGGIQSDTLDLNLPKIGEYYFSFELRLDDNVIRKYTRDFIAQGQLTGAVRTEAQFIIDYLHNVDFSECFADCRTAVQNLGTQQKFTAMFNAKLNQLNVDTLAFTAYISGLYDILLDSAMAVQASCNLSPCDIYKQPMLLDVSPGGQYALFDETGTALETDLNVLYMGFKNGVFNTLSPGDPTYQANLITLDNGTVSSPYAASFTLQDLVKYWKPEWAELFLSLHPEYCKLQFCQTNTASYNWDAKLREIYTRATDIPLIDTISPVAYSYTNGAWLLPADPFFKPGGAGYAHAASMLADLTMYSQNVLQLNNISSGVPVKNLSAFTDYMLYCADGGWTTNTQHGNADTWTNCTVDPACRVPDREWAACRDAYLELKEKYYRLVQNETTCADVCEVGEPYTLPSAGEPVQPGCPPGATGNLVNAGLIILGNDRYRLVDSVNSTETIWTVLYGSASNPPADSLYCPDGTVLQKTFFSTFSVEIPGETLNFYKEYCGVWVIVCSRELCEPGSIYADGTLGGSDSYYTLSGSDEQDEYHITSAEPELSGCPEGSTVSKTFYPCLQVYLNGNVTYYINVWVRKCEGVQNGGSGGNMRMAGGTGSAKSKPVAQQAAKVQSYQTVTDFRAPGMQYSVVKDTTGMAKPAQRAGFSAYQFYQNVAFRPTMIGSLKFKKVWVATSTQGGTAGGGGGMKMRTNLESIDCETDFEITNTNVACESPQTGDDGKLYNITLKTGRTPCTTKPVVASVYVLFSNGMTQLLDHVTLDGTTNTGSYCVADFYSLGTTVFVCGLIDCTEPDPCPPALATKTSRFGYAVQGAVWQLDTADYFNAQRDSLNALIDSNCTINADRWMENLSADLTGYSAPQISMLKEGLIALCIAGGDLSRPWGGSTVPSGKEVVVNGISCASFADVIRAALGISTFTPGLNPWVIEDGPYPHSPVLQGAEVTVSYADSALCDRLSQLRPPGASDSQFYSYLKTTYGTAMNLSQADFEVLLAACGNCKYILAKDIILPVFLQPGATGCITRSEFNAALDSLNGQFGSPLTGNEEQYPAILANFMNHTFGFGLSYDRYAAFAADTLDLLCNEPPFTTAVPDPYDCVRTLIEVAVANARAEYEAYIAEEMRKFREAYVQTCASARTLVTLAAKEQTYHYTLYYYDQAGNLVRTIPPDGVKFLSAADRQRVQEERDLQAVAADCEYNGPLVEADKTEAFNALSSALAQEGASAVEMWLYGTGSKQFIAATPDLRYLYQACLNGNLLSVDIYSLHSEGPGQVGITRSNHVTAAIGPDVLSRAWTHLVVQGYNPATGSLQIWVNGVQHTPVPGAPTAGCGWSMNAGPVDITENLATLKHLRVYPGRLMEGAEILANAQSLCFRAENIDLLSWYRFQVPPAENTIVVNPACEYNGPDVEAVKSVALTDLSSTIANSGSSAIEFWMYGSGSKQFYAATPDLKYIFQACMKGNLLSVDIYSIDEIAPGQVNIELSNHIATSISAATLNNAWAHVVLQGTNLASGTLQIWVNGQLGTPLGGSQSAGCSWELKAAPLYITDNITALKHLRLYDRQLLSGEILANAQSTCFRADNLSMMAWYRFDMDPAEDESSVVINTGGPELRYDPLYPPHTFKTTYAYNSTNQVVKQKTPDAGSSDFWYDRLSRLAVSQNAKQLGDDRFSYTRYDALGRITEVGEKQTANTLGTGGFVLNTTTLGNFLAGGTNSQITQTIYDAVPTGGAGVQTSLPQLNLRKRVAASVYRDTPASTDINATYYSYDLAGNVNTFWQQVHGLGTKKIGYEYDLVSGKVNFVAYQHGQNDQFYYQYKYDAENRLTEAWSAVEASVSSTGFGSTLTDPARRQDAEYNYYLHGPLARTVLGDVDNRLQGLDYAYTLQGWLKGMNGTKLDPAEEMGGDGAQVGVDALAYSLGYYTGDYIPIGGNTAAAFKRTYGQQPGDATGLSLYNGNIAWGTLAIRGLDNAAPQGLSYRYDQLNRLTRARRHDLNGVSTTWGSGSLITEHAENFSYDGNGNILAVKRNTENFTMDRLAYAYTPNTNKLRHVKDTVGSAYFVYELGNQPDDNYSYDAIGNLVGDASEGITNIDWTVYGKIKRISKGSDHMDFTYDPSGNRVSKKVGDLTSFYVRDAQGNPLAIYDNAGLVINWREQQFYGSSRLGTWKPNITVSGGGATSIWDSLGRKQYELSNHLGNVLAVINDKRSFDGSVYTSQRVLGRDYYAFGSLMPERKLGSYRYGFNGKENDNEVKWEGNQQDYGMRIYDPRLGRFLSVDPITREYPELTPYQFASNTPIQATDLDGLEADFSSAKVELWEHTSRDNIVEKPIRFVANIGKFVYNGIIETAEHVSNVNPIYNLNNKGAGYKKILNNAKDGATGAYNWSVNTTWKEKGEDIITVSKDPHTWEGLSAAWLTRKFTPKLKTTKVPSAAELAILRYPGVFADYSKRTLAQLRKTIKSTEATIIEHQNYVKNPLSKPGLTNDVWSKMNGQARKGLTDKWKKDIERNKAYLEIAKKIYETKQNE